MYIYILYFDVIYRLGLHDMTYMYSCVELQHRHFNGARLRACCVPVCLFTCLLAHESFWCFLPFKVADDCLMTMTNICGH